jgi:hypothetical protein
MTAAPNSCIRLDVPLLPALPITPHLLVSFAYAHAWGVALIASPCSAEIQPLATS